MADDLPPISSHLEFQPASDSPKLSPRCARRKFNDKVELTPETSPGPGIGSWAIGRLAVSCWMGEEHFQFTVATHVDVSKA